jgi:uncharacterized Zn finger protein (UPF0148 family)
MTSCPRCGRDLPADVAREGMFCPYCGERLERAESSEPSETTSTFEVHRDELILEDLLTEEERAAVEALPAGSALLIGLRGGEEDSRFLLDAEETTLGRSPDSDIFLDDVTVSRHHAYIRRDEDGFSVVDRGSTNGTYVNRVIIDTAHLEMGDELQVGKYRVRYFHSLKSSGAEDSAP